MKILIRDLDVSDKFADLPKGITRKELTRAILSNDKVVERFTIKLAKIKGINLEENK